MRDETVYVLIVILAVAIILVAYTGFNKAYGGNFFENIFPDFGESKDGAGKLKNIVIYDSPTELETNDNIFTYDGINKKPIIWEEPDVKIETEDNVFDGIDIHGGFYGFYLKAMKDEGWDETVFNKPMSIKNNKWDDVFFCVEKIDSNSLAADLGKPVSESENCEEYKVLT